MLAAGPYHYPCMNRSLSLTVTFSGGAGLLGGVLIGEALENHEDREQQEAYQEGMSDHFTNRYIRS